nr:hypothetical protein [Lachnospira eligens]
MISLYFSVDKKYMPDIKNGTKPVSVRTFQIAAGRWEELQFHSYHPWSVSTSLSDGAG